MLSLLLSLASSDAQACSPMLSEEVRSFPEWGARGIGVDSRILLQIGVDRLDDPDGLDLDVRDAKGEPIAGQVEVIFSVATYPSLVSLSFVPETELPADSEIRATAIGVREGDELEPASVLFETGSVQAERSIADVELMSWALMPQDECWGERDEVALTIYGPGTGEAVYAFAVDQAGEPTEEILGVFLADDQVQAILTLPVEATCIAIVTEQADGFQEAPLILCEDQIWDGELICGTGDGIFRGGCSTGGAPAGLFAGLIGLLGLVRRRRAGPVS
ncbi:MAG: MYXO-CTERM domain-containing protein [Cognaticolwellia sp.]|jgi:MYXO-CTERM domain-containing protein